MDTIAKRFEKYLQNECAEEWHVKVENESYCGYYTNIKRFELYYDGDYESWMITGEDIALDMISELIKIAEKFDMI